MLITPKDSSNPNVALSELQVNRFTTGLIFKNKEKRTYFPLKDYSGKQILINF